MAAANAFATENVAPPSENVTLLLLQLHAIEQCQPFQGPRQAGEQGPVPSRAHSEETELLLTHVRNVCGCQHSVTRQSEPVHLRANHGISTNCGCCVCDYSLHYEEKTKISPGGLKSSIEIATEIILCPARQQIIPSSRTRRKHKQKMPATHLAARLPRARQRVR
ncbi:hypothetical protein EVAR_64802_1 [Eumeta japonica]|uniref:Uncharacterized protein n=1 Tax=Eumeta variegata TaxID=151549 RepID=A0A4C1ZSY3_EUMVA|nr:hypothetical protein EVAR_64802_1 [Eumeta japonica]